MRLYQNPIYPHYFADPFVWEHRGIYFAVGTGPVAQTAQAGEGDFTASQIQGEERAFPLLRSDNFVDWKFLGGALRVPDSLRGGEFWAPEVARDGGRFYLYYSVSLEGLKHQLRVAVSDRAEGPYEDSGLLMADVQASPFAIDAHPFQDTDGEWYLFYARDFLDFSSDQRAGTALVVDRLCEMMQLAGDAQVVARARFDWQRFKTNREMYGRVFDWHTLEGPCVRKHKGLYYCFYSGGCYENASYGVDYAIATSVLGPYTDEGCSGGPRVLKTIPGHVIGPGHHSIVIGPDGETEYIAYHAWDKDLTARCMYFDQLVWTADGPRCLGPTWTPQMVPVNE